MPICMMPHWLILTTLILAFLTPITRCEQMAAGLLMEEVVGGCHLVSGLTRAQRRLCTRAPTSAAAALQGLQTAVRECQHQLKWHRWNCSSLEPKRLNPHSTVMLKRGYRESAFVHAIAAAGVAHAVARACSQGQVLACDCDPGNHRRNEQLLENSVDTPNTKEAAYRWKWGGCSHNMDYGIHFSKMFLDSREKEGDLHSKVNLHNNEAGRLAVSSNMQVRCKCHGTSGSCQLKTCWRAAPDFRLVGKQLKKKYRNALMVGQSNVNNDLPRVAKKRNRRKDKSTRRRAWNPNKKQRGKWRDWSQPTDAILFYERSPSFCEADSELDVIGTAGRRCARSRPSSAPGSCGALCCGRGHDHLRIRTKKRCRCRFIWCCRVECDTCVQDEYVAVCK